MNQEQGGESTKYDFPEKMIGHTFKQEYDFSCPKCGAKHWAKSSILMTDFGLNRGRGQCLKCKAYLFLRIDENNEQMEASLC